MPVIQAVHYGPCEGFQQSYSQMMEYIGENEYDVKWEAMEFYRTDPMAEPNVTKWETLITMPLK
jgi:effector-binding domain-containing protein